MAWRTIIPSASAGWIELVAHLSIALRRRVGQILDIHIDRHPALSQEERDDLGRHIQSSVLFLAVSSPGYLSDPRTHWELDTALSAESNVQRLMFVESLPPGPHDPQPKALDDFRKFVFWETDEATGNPAPLTPDQHRTEFMDSIEELADAVSRRLLVLVPKTTPAPKAAEPEPTEAEVSPPAKPAPVIEEAPPPAAPPPKPEAKPQPKAAVAAPAAMPAPESPSVRTGGRVAMGIFLLVAVGVLAAGWYFQSEVAGAATTLVDTVRSMLGPSQ